MSPSKPKLKGAIISFQTGLVQGWALAVEALRAYARLGAMLGCPEDAAALRKMADRLEKDGPPTPAHVAGEKEAS